MRLTEECIFFGFAPPSEDEAGLRELRNVIFNDLLNACLHFRRNVTSRNLLKQRALSRRQVFTEFGLPLSDLVYWDRVQLQPVSVGRSAGCENSTYKAVNASVDDRNLDLHRKGLILTLLEQLSQAGTASEKEAC